MLEHYFLKPDTVDRIRACWLAEPIERYVTILADDGYAASNIRTRVPILRRFAEFSWQRGARTWAELPEHIGPFVAQWLVERKCGRSAERSRQFANEIRRPVEQLVSQLVPSFVARGRSRRTTDPFSTEAPGFFAYLSDERGLRDPSIAHYGHYLRIFETYLKRIELDRLEELSPAILSAFVTDASQGLSKTTIVGFCSSLRVFLRYCHRQQLIARDLSQLVEQPRTYRLSQVPRSITWDEVRCMLECVDRRTGVGKRDYAIVLLLVTYGLRAREVSALSLDDVDWERERLLVPERKAGHCTAYPLSAVVGEALLDYLKNARPQTDQREIFFRALAPHTPLHWHVISSRAAHYLRKAGIRVRRPGSHTLRHTCVQRLIDAEFPLKTIGDYVGHRSASSTEIYTKVAVESLREVALGDGEELL